MPDINRDRFTEEDIYRAVKGAMRAGCNVVVEISPSGTIRLVPVAALVAPASNAEPAPSAPLRDILTMRDLAKHWNISSRSVNNAITAGKINHFRIGSLIRIRREEVERIDREGGMVPKPVKDDPIPYLPPTIPYERASPRKRRPK